MTNRIVMDEKIIVIMAGLSAAERSGEADLIF